MSAVAHIDEYKTGRFYSDEFRGTMSWNGYENNVLLRNEGLDSKGVPNFNDVAMALGADDLGDSRGVALLDFDRDGDLDLAVSHNPGLSGAPTAGRASLWRNDIGHERPWISVELEGTTSNRDGVGALLRLTTAEGTQTQVASAGSGYASQHGKRIHFGLGEAKVAERLVVRWPSGVEDACEGLAARQVVRLVEGEGCSVD